MLYGVVSAYRGTASVAEAAALSTPTSTPEPTDTPEPIPTPITPEQAAQLAAQVVSNSSLLSAESSNVNGLNAYKITFTNKDAVYVSLDGQILSVQVAPVVVNLAPPAKVKNNKNNNQSNGTSASNHDSHEEHDD
jgi:hypothetical protein